MYRPQADEFPVFYKGYVDKIRYLISEVPIEYSDTSLHILQTEII